jgi:trans-2,3-dihydro-3-hydroxyanthranilate isomerase
MGRPSVMALQLVVTNGRLASAEIGGKTVMVSRGELLV